VEMASVMWSAQRAAVSNSILGIPAKVTWTLDSTRLEQIYIATYYSK
jgi:poly(A) polymerase Pap1